jgi:hypothetical protein
MPERSVASKMFESLLVGTVETIARGVVKAGESIAGDMKKALKKEAFKVGLVEKGLEAWRKNNLGDIEDLPDSLTEEKGDQRS